MKSHARPHIQDSEESKSSPLFAIHLSPVPQSQATALLQTLTHIFEEPSKLLLRSTSSARSLSSNKDPRSSYTGPFPISSPSPEPFLFLFQEELEDFPLPTVQHCQTVLNQMRYSSILLLVCQDSEQHKPDIHFFNCDEVEVSRALLACVKQRTKYTPSCLPAPSSFGRLEPSILSKAKPLKTFLFYL